MSELIRNSTPAQRARGQSFGEKFQNAARVALNGGELINGATADFGLQLSAASNHRCDYAGIGSQPFDSQELSYRIRFTPTFALNDGSFHCIFDLDQGGNRTSLIIRNDGGLTVIFTGGTFTEVLAGWGSNWIQNGSNEIAASVDASSGKVWINNVKIIDSAILKTGSIPDGKLSVGAYNTGSFPFDGVIHDVEFYKSLLVAQEVSDFYTHSTYNYRNKAIGDWPMLDAQDDPGVKTLDVSGSGANAVFGAGVATPTKLAKRGYSTNGNDHMQTASFVSSLPTLTSITVARLASTSSQCISSLEKTDNSNIGFINLYSGGQLQFYVGGTGATQAAKFDYADPRGSLVIIVGTHDGVDTCIMVNGVQGTDATVPTAPAVDSDGVLTIFKRGSLATSTKAGGEVYGQIILPFAMTPIQIYDITGKIKRSINRV